MYRVRQKGDCCQLCNSCSMVLTFDVQSCILSIMEVRMEQKQTNKNQLLGNRVLVTVVMSPSTVTQGSLTLHVPSVSRELMNMGVVELVGNGPEMADFPVNVGDVVLYEPGRGSGLNSRLDGSSDGRQRLLLEKEHVLGVVETQHTRSNV